MPFCRRSRRRLVRAILMCEPSRGGVTNHECHRSLHATPPRESTCVGAVAPRAPTKIIPHLIGQQRGKGFEGDNLKTQVLRHCPEMPTCLCRTPGHTLRITSGRRASIQQKTGLSRSSSEHGLLEVGAEVVGEVVGQGLPSLVPPYDGTSVRV